MDNLAHNLRIKYGLTTDPTDIQITEWAGKSQDCIDSGMNAEDAGRYAAYEAFGELDAVLLFSEADTILALLSRAAAKK